MKKVVSFSLWGVDPKYCIGAVRNAHLVSEIYPGWEARFYCGSSVPSEVIEDLKNAGNHVNVILRGEVGDWTGMFWRFEPISEPEVEVMISRDTDSRVCHRESEAVKEWLSSNKLFHVMRDHPAHGTEVLGGMWGARKPILFDIKHLIDAYVKGNFWQVDQNFLREVIWPRVSYTTITHDEFFSKNCPFPTRRDGGKFVGQVYDKNDEPNLEYEKSLMKAISRTQS